MTKRHLNLANSAASRDGLVCQICDSTDQLDHSAWDQVCGSGNWGMNLNFLRIQQESLEGQANVWFVLIRDARNKPVACAVLALFYCDMLRSESNLAKLLGQMRRIFPHFLHVGVLFCGLPVPCGGNHLCIVESISPDLVLRCLDRNMQELAGQQRARLIVFRAFDDESIQQLNTLQQLGYLEGQSYPMYELHRSFDSIEAYRNTLRSRYRRQFDASLRKYETQRLKVAHYTNSKAIEQGYTDQLHELYLQVWARQSQRLEVLPASFFRHLPVAISDRVLLTVIGRNGTPLAFAYGVLTGRCFHNLYVGLDYSLNDDCDLYFNIFYKSMEIAFKHGVDHIALGQTSGQFKSRLGAVEQRRYFLVRATSSIGHVALRRLSNLMFPELPPIKRRRVFKDF